MAELSGLMADAARLRDRGHGRLISYSRKVFIPLTQLCRDVCHYCTFAERPARRRMPAYLSPDEVLAIARAGAGGRLHRRRCSRSATSRSCATRRRARRWRALGHETTIDYLAAMCALVLRETGLLPHANPGVMTREEIAGAARGHASARASCSKSTRERLCERGGAALRLARQAAGGAAGDDRGGRRAEGAVHHRHPDRHRRDARGADRGAAGDPRPASTRTATSRKSSSRISAPSPTRAWPTRREPDARRPALDHRRRAADLRAGHEHPGAAQPAARRAIRSLIARRHQRLGRRLAGDARSRESRGAVARDRRSCARATRRRGQAAGRAAGDLSRLCARRPTRWLDARASPRRCCAHERRRGLRARRRLGARATRETAAPRRMSWRATSIPAIARNRRSRDRRPAARRARDRRACSRRAAPTIAASRGAADALRQAVSGDVVRYVVNRNINYTNICYFRCRFCAFSKGKHARGPARHALRPRARRDRAARASRPGSAAPPRSACRAASIPTTPARPISRSAAPSRRRCRDMHVHAFSPLEVTHGADDAAAADRATSWRSCKAAGPRHPAGHRGRNPRRRGPRHHLPRQAQHRAMARRAARRARARPAHDLDHHVRPRRDLARTGRAICWRCATCRRETGGFTEFVPLPFVHMEAPMYLQGPRPPRPDLPRGGADARGRAAGAASARSPTSRPRG